MLGTFGNWLKAVIVLSRIEIELYSRWLDFYSASPGAFFLLATGALYTAVIESRRAYVCLSEGNISGFGYEALANILSQQPSLSAALSTRGTQRGRRRTARMIKLPIDSHLFSTPPPAMAGDAGHRWYGRPQNENNSRKAACASIYIPQPSCLHSDVSSVPFRRSRNPTFEHAHVGYVWWGRIALLLYWMFIQMRQKWYSQILEKSTASEVLSIFVK